MKNQHIPAALAAAMLLTACTEGQYWTEPDTLGNTVAFAKTNDAITYGWDEEIPSQIFITVSRSEAGPALTVPVTFESSSDLFTGGPTVEFPAGSLTAQYPVNVAAGTEQGVEYSISLSLEEPDDLILQPNPDNMEYSLTVIRDWHWVAAGTANCWSAWVGNIDDNGLGDSIEVPVEKAADYPAAKGTLARLVSPYYVMEPEYAEPGADIQFYVNADGSVTYTPNWQYIGEQDSDANYFVLGMSAAYGSSFTMQDNFFVLDGIIGYTVSLVNKKLYLYTFETLAWEWAVPAE